MSQALPFRRLRDAADIEALRVAALEDAHGVTCPSFVVEKDGAIAGSISLDAAPLVLLWLDSRKVKARESYRVLQAIEERVRSAGDRQMFLACANHSPFYPFLPRLGFHNLGHTTLFIKPLA